MKAEEILSFLETGALVVDESTRGKVEVFGPEAGLFLHNLSTSDIKGMLVGPEVRCFLVTLGRGPLRGGRSIMFC